MPSIIAKNSYGGTFSVITYVNDLSIAFAQCLAGLLTLTVHGLDLNIRPVNNITITEVHAGNYLQQTSESCTTIALCNFSYKEVRKILVDVILPPVSLRINYQILKVSYNYSR